MMDRIKFDKGWKILIYFDIVLPAILFILAFITDLPFLSKIFHSYEIFISNPIPDFKSIIGIIGLIYHLGIIIYAVTKRDFTDLLLSAIISLAVAAYFWFGINYVIIRPLNFSSFISKESNIKERSIMDRKVEVWYLGHSGFAVDIGNDFLIFDYYLDHSEDNKRSLSSGVIEPSEIKDKKVYVFASHRHPDHFNPVILSWKEQLSDIHYFLSYDIPQKYHREWTNILKYNETYQDQNLSIQTFKSTDEGIAFLVNIDGINIYHAGDLNWWHWNGEPKSWNNNMAALFKQEVDQIKKHPIDIAFLTADPRQESAELMGMEWFLNEVDVKVAFPMHFENNYSIMDRIKNKAENNPVFKKVKTISRRGECFSITL